MPDPIITPPCSNCGSNKHWVIGRIFEERKTWNPETQECIDREETCTDLWIFCGACGTYIEDEETPIHQLLQEQ